MNVNERLAQLNVDVPSSVAEEVIGQDLHRGRVALTRRRVRRGVVGVSFAFAVAATGVLGHTAITDSATNPPVAVGPDSLVHSEPSVRLVAYTGQQLPGFTVTSIPEGYVLQGSEPAYLTIAREGDNTPANFFIDKIMVALKSGNAPTSYEGTPVTVNGQLGAIAVGVEDGVRTLEYTVGNNSFEIQAWSNIGLTDAQLVAFAEGVTATDAVVAPVG
ncbi:hypothetical protein ACWFRB_08870 [Rhodococcus sp. NPDC055112]